MWIGQDMEDAKECAYLVATIYKKGGGVLDLNN